MRAPAPCRDAIVEEPVPLRFAAGGFCLLEEQLTRMTATLGKILLFGLLLLVLAACGGPSYRVRVLDTSEGSGLKGTQKPYEVNGERFDPLLHADGFSEEGTASWYGQDFHGRKTSNGEIYDMHELTAAHKTLPMNVYLRVTNRGNGRQSVVRVNDRGPFVKGRIIDLSYAAAKELGVVGPGTAPVRIEALGFREVVAAGDAYAYRQPTSYESGPYTVQVGAFTVLQNAQRLADELRRTHGEASVVEGWVSGQRFHRVRVGLYQTLAQAEQARVEFDGKGFHNSFVVAKD